MQEPYWCCKWNFWMWNNLQWQDDSDWLADSIWSNQYILVANELYMSEVRTDLCSTAFFFKCTAGRKRLVGSFAEQSPPVSAYQGKLLGLMTVHLVLLGINQLLPGLCGKVVIYSNCDIALQKVEGLPLLRIPSQCKYAHILKTFWWIVPHSLFQWNLSIFVPTRMIRWTSVFSLGQPNSIVWWMLELNLNEPFRMPSRLVCQPACQIFPL